MSAACCSTALALFCFTSLCLEVAAAAASLVSGMPVLAPFNRPYIAASLRRAGLRMHGAAGCCASMVLVRLPPH